MAGYLINNYDGTPLFELPDGSISHNLDINLIGKNFPNYGEAFNESLLFMLQHFSGEFSPNRAITGQMWFDTVEKKIKILNANKKWRSVGSAEVENLAKLRETDPALTNLVNELSKGALVLDSGTNQLFVSNGTSLNLIGPDGVAGFGKTTFVSESVTDDSGFKRPVINGYLNGEIIIVIAWSNFDLVAGTIPGFIKIYRGINVKLDVKFIGSLKGNAESATQFETKRKINGIDFNGTADIEVQSRTYNYLRSGNYISGNDFDGQNEITWNIEADEDNIENKIVVRSANKTIKASKLIGDVQGSLYNADSTVAYDMTSRTFQGVSFKGNILASDSTVFFDATTKTVLSSAIKLADNILASDNSVFFNAITKVATANTIKVETSILASDDSIFYDVATKKIIVDTVKVSTDMVNSDDSEFYNVADKKLTVNTVKVNTDIINSDDSTFYDVATKIVTASRFVGTHKGNILASDDTAFYNASTKTATATTFTGSLTGNADTATKVNNSITPGNYISGDSFDGSVNRTWSVNASVNNQDGKIVVRNSLGKIFVSSIEATGEIRTGGDIITTGGDVIISSDMRLKKDIETISNALATVNKMRGVNFTKIVNDQRSTGLIAQEVREHIPEVVKEDDDGNLSIAYSNLVGYLVEAIKELTAEVHMLKEKIEN